MVGRTSMTIMALVGPALRTDVNAAGVEELVVGLRAATPGRFPFTP